MTAPGDEDGGLVVADEPRLRAPDGAEPSPAPVDPPPPIDPGELHRQSIVIDTHNDVTLRLTDEPAFDFGKRASKGHTDLVRMREGGLDAQFFSVWVNPKLFEGEAAWERSLAMFEAIHRTAKGLKGQVDLVRTSDELRATVAAEKVAFLIGVEGAHALGELGTPDKALLRVRRWYELGARYLTLTWTNTNALGGSSGDQRGKRTGLTPLGLRTIGLMNDLGMMVDVSHVSDRTFLEAIEASRAPVLASHSGLRALRDHHRNLSDEMLRALAKNGGAVCIVYYPDFLDDDWAKARREARRTGSEIKAEAVKVGRVVDHIDHAVKVAGIDHVCLGSDFDGIGQAPVGLEDVSKLPNLTKELLHRGYSEGDVRKILGENLLRVFEAVEAAARQSPEAEAGPSEPADGG